MNKNLEQFTNCLYEYIDLYTVLLKDILDYQDVKLERPEEQSRNLFDEINIKLMRLNCLKYMMYHIELEEPEK